MLAVMGEVQAIPELDNATTPLRVDRCVCFDQPFEKLLALSQEHGWGFEELSEATGCGRGCGMCRPYIRVVLTTGRTSIPLTNGSTLRAIADRAARHREADSPTGGSPTG